MLTVEQIEIMMDALDAWVEEKASAAQVGEMFSKASNGPLAQAFREAAEDVRLEHRSRRDQAIVIKAELLKMRDRAEIDEL